MHPYRTPPFTPEGWQEVMEEVRNGSPDTPERRAGFKLAEAADFLVQQALEQETGAERRAGEGG